MQNILAPWGANTSNQYAQAAGGVLGGALGAMGSIGQGFATSLGNAGSAYMQGLGQQGTAYANAYNGYAGGIGSLGQSASQGLGYLGQGLTGLGNAQAGAYGAYSQGLGSVANSIGQERAGFYGSNSMAEAARQAALGNIGTAALSSYGGAANNAMQAWAQNQLAYNQALAGLGASNQAGLSQLGQSRNAALGNMGGAYADLGGKLGAASVLGNLNFNMSDGGSGGTGFRATGPDGEIASGSYGGGGGGFTASGSRTSDSSQLQDIGAPAYAGLSGLQSNLMASDISGAMNNNYVDGMNRLDAQHYSSRGMPSQMLGQTLSGLLSLGKDAYGQVRGGMNQFYATQNDPRNRGDYSGILASLANGYGSVRSDLNNSRDSLNYAYGDNSRRLDDYRGSLRSGFDSANSNIGGVLGALNSGWDRVSSSLQSSFGDTFGDSMKRLFPTADESAASSRRQGLADTIMKYRMKGVNPRELNDLAREMGVTL